MITTTRSTDANGSSPAAQLASGDDRSHSVRSGLRRALATLTLVLGLAGGALVADVSPAAATGPVTLQANTGNRNASLGVFRWVYAPSVGHYVWVQVNVAEKRTDAKGRFYVSVAPGYYYTYTTVMTSLRIDTNTPCYIQTYGQSPYVSGATPSVTVLFGGENENCW